jgi:ribosomal protein S21
MNVQVYVRNGDVDKALRRLKKACAQNGVTTDMKAKDFYLRPGQKRRLKLVRAQIKRRKFVAKFGL